MYPYIFLSNKDMIVGGEGGFRIIVHLTSQIWSIIPL